MMVGRVIDKRFRPSYIGDPSHMVMCVVLCVFVSFIMAAVLFVVKRD